MTSRIVKFLRACSIAALVVVSYPNWTQAGWQVFTVTDGLAGVATHGIAQDAQGALWFATGTGISKYDGLTWTTYRQESGLWNTAVATLLIDHEGGLWAGTWQGVYWLAPGTPWFQGFGSWNTGAFPTDNVTAMAEDHRGDLWFGTGLYYNDPEGGIVHFDRHHWTSHTHNNTPGLRGGNIAAIAEDAYGALWFATDQALCRLDSTRTVWTDATDSLPSNSIPWSLYSDAHGTLWVGTNNGLSYRDRTGWHALTSADGLPSPGKVVAILVDHEDVLWVGTDNGGVGCRTGGHWERFTTSDGLPSNEVRTIYEDRSGRIWVVTGSGDVVMHDRSYWKTLVDSAGVLSGPVDAAWRARDGSLWFGSRNGVAWLDKGQWSYSGPNLYVGTSVTSLFEDHLGHMWAASWGGGVARYDHSSWKTWGTAQGLPSAMVTSLAEERDGTVLAGTTQGIGVFDSTRSRWDSVFVHSPLDSSVNNISELLSDESGRTWVGTAALWKLASNSSTCVSYPSNFVSALCEDRRGRIWFGRWWEGFYVFHPDTMLITHYSVAEGVGSQFPSCIMEDSRGYMWGGHRTGISRFDGSEWAVFKNSDGLIGSDVNSVVEDTLGRMVIATDQGVSIYQPDTMPPLTIINVRPSRLLPTGKAQAGYLAAFGETRGVEFSYSLDAQPWSSWSPQQSWSGQNLAEGPHRLSVKARDRLNNQEHVPATADFIVDAASPVAAIRAPAQGAAVRGAVEITGTASATRLVRWVLRVRRAEEQREWTLVDAAVNDSSSTSVTNGPLGVWQTASLRDGLYQLGLEVTDSLSRTTQTIVEVSVDNHFPHADQTSPVRVSAMAGGDVYSRMGDAHLYFPPHAFAADTDVTVTIDPAGAETPDSLGAGQRRVSGAFDIAWSQAALAKPVTLDMTISSPLNAGEAAVLHRRDPVTHVWQPLGGTPNAQRATVSASVEVAGRYALYLGIGPTLGSEPLSGVSFTPRVFSPHGTFGTSEVAIGFSLGQPAAVTVKIFNRAGRLVRTLLNGASLSGGANLVRWDGRDDGASIVDDGLYIVTVEGLGRTRSQTLAVVR